MLCRRLFRSLVGVGGFEWGGFWGSVYPLLRSRRLAVPLLQRVTFGKRPKSNQKVFAPPLGASLRLGMPSLRLESVGRRDGPSMAQHG